MNAQAHYDLAVATRSQDARIEQRDSEERYRWIVQKSVRVLAMLYMVALGVSAVSGESAAQSTCPRVEMTIVAPGPSATNRPVRHGDRTIFVPQNAITATGDISEIKVAGNDAETLITIKYHPAAAARLLDATTDRDGQRMAFVVDDDVLLAFTWEGFYGIGPHGTQLSLLDYGLARAQKLIASIQDCNATTNP